MEFHPREPIKRRVKSIYGNVDSQSAGLLAHLALGQPANESSNLLKRPSALAATWRRFAQFPTGAWR